MRILFIALVMGYFSLNAAVWQTLPGHLRYDQVCFLTSHNSYAAKDHGFFYAQQNLSIDKQLALGVRGLMLDTYIENDQVLLCHKGPKLTRLLCRGKEPMPLEKSLTTIRTFLEDNPEEVITIFLETYLRRSHAMVDGPFKEAGLAQYCLKPADWPAKDSVWPTLDWMRAHNKRLIIFNSQSQTNLCFNEWQHVAENQWGTLHPVRACRERPKSQSYRTHQRSLYLLNYFPMFKLNFDNAYHSINTGRLAVFLRRVLEHGLSTGSNTTLMPTFLCIDFVEVGNGLQHVIKINKIKNSLSN